MHGLGRLEAEIMERLWSHGRPTSVREVLEDLRQERTIAYTTVMTVMDNLHKKGLLHRHPRQRAYLYQPALSNAAYTAQVMQEALATGGNQTVTLIHFLERLPPEEHQALGAALSVTRSGES